MADPTPFLSTITGASAGLVAIVGGLLVNRFVGIDSEQQGAQALLDQAEERLRIADVRAKAAQEVWESFEAAEFLDEPDVLDALRRGARDVTQLDRELLARTPLTAEQVQHYLQEAAAEFALAQQQLDESIKPASELTAEQWRSVTWANADGELDDALPLPRWPRVREAAFDAVVEARAIEREKLDAAKRTKLPYAIPNINSLLLGAGFTAPMSPVARALITNRGLQRSDQSRSQLTADKERAAQRREDAQIEAYRLRERRDAIVRPDRQLWIGLGVLLYPTIVGIVLPVMTMAGGPTAFTGWIRALGVLFVTALVWLLGYMAYLAVRLSRRGRSSVGRSRK
ncbi:hypothetical protein SAMN04489727_8695 [Amycolatopsis tolypomycina]|uniref:Uncharacterized protein n=1 Tax=Amycolatopsis tolypomycina TaxID=208445 RepID=A0A1H5CBT1_9PSEU|nr:hypothetical protein [Amycolatopsis tolypomycina]SED64007.1 hypothetical protein SAMN04489727_8695 [Amycolatopsis tolypomycina]